MYRHGEAMPDPRHCAECVGSGAQMGDFAEVLERVPFLRDRVRLRVVDPADYDDRIGQQLNGLALGG